MATGHMTCARCGGAIPPGTGYVKGSKGKPAHLKCPPKGKALLRLDGRSVLIVEDHEDSRDAMRLIIESFGPTVHLAPNGPDALTIVKDQRPDVILCDVKMPGMDGFAFLRRLREDPTYARVRVVAVTGLSGPAERMRAWEAGFDGYLAKPIDYDALAALLARVFWAHRPEANA